MDERYIASMQAHMREAKFDLEQLAEIVNQNGFLDRLLQKSAERVLQTTIEACIGIAKHWVKSLTKPGLCIGREKDS